MVWSSCGHHFVEDVDVDADAFFDGNDATNLTNGLDDLTRFADDSSHVFRVYLDGECNKSVGLFFANNNFFRMVDDVGNDVFEKLFHFDFLNNDSTVLVG